LLFESTKLHKKNELTKFFFKKDKKVSKKLPEKCLEQGMWKKKFCRSIYFAYFCNLLLEYFIYKNVVET